jgi:outer membrane protein insertion porin family
MEIIELQAWFYCGWDSLTASSLRFWNSPTAVEYLERNSMKYLVLLACALLPVDHGVASEPSIRSIEVEGNLRVPSVSVLHAMRSRAGLPLDRAAIADDIRRIHGMRLFRTVEICAHPVAKDGTGLIVRVRERPFVDWFSIEGVNDRLSLQIHEMLRKNRTEVGRATPYDPAAGAKAARIVRTWLAARHYPLAEVRVTCDDKGGTTVVRLRIHLGPELRESEITFTGNHSISSSELRELMSETRSRCWWTGWGRDGYFSSGRLKADMERIRQFYRSRGFAAVTLGRPDTTVRYSRPKAWSPRRLTGRALVLHVHIPVYEGGAYVLRSVSVEGNAGAASEEVASIAQTLRNPSRYDSESLEDVRNQISEALGRAGYAFAHVELEESVDRGALAVHARFRIFPGDPVLLGRIEFEGNRRVPENFLRRELRIGEGQVFNSRKVDESIRRLNRSGLIEELRREDVLILEDSSAGTARLTFRLKEKPPQGIYGAGCTLGGRGGYIGILYTAFNLLGLGERFSIQMDGGASSSNLLLTLAGQHFLGSPFTLGLSVFNRYSGINVAGIVPDASDLVRLLTDHRLGARLGGSYSVGARAQAEIGLRFEREDLGDSNGSRDSSLWKSELSPAFVYDSAAISARKAGGFRISAAASFSFQSLMNSAESVGGSARLTRFAADPWTSGRNSFAFDLHFAAIRPFTAHGIAPEERLYPGGELLRGFRPGGLAIWATGRDGSAGGFRPVGADTAVSASIEYRLPIVGPLSSAAFVDLGWTRLDPERLNDPNLTLVGATNELIRVSTGGELRVELPVIHQPARFIVAWNPFRLTQLLREGTSMERIADPRGLVRLALGSPHEVRSLEFDDWRTRRLATDPKTEF